MFNTENTLSTVDNSLIEIKIAIQHALHKTNHAIDKLRVLELTEILINNMIKELMLNEEKQDKIKHTQHE